MAAAWNSAANLATNWNPVSSSFSFAPPTLPGVRQVATPVAVNPAPGPQTGPVDPSQNLPIPPPGRQQALALAFQAAQPPDFTSVRSPLEGAAKMLTAGLYGQERNALARGNAANNQAMANMLMGGQSGPSDPRSQQLGQLLQSGAMNASDLAPLVLAKMGMGGQTIGPPSPLTGVSLIHDAFGNITGRIDAMGNRMPDQGQGQPTGQGQGSAGGASSPSSSGASPTAGAGPSAQGATAPVILGNGSTLDPGIKLIGPLAPFGWQQGVKNGITPVLVNVMSGETKDGAGDPQAQANVFSADLNNKSTSYFAVRDAARGFQAAIPPATQPISGPSAAALVANFARAINPNTVLKAGDTLDPGTIAAASNSGFTDSMMSELNKALTGKGGISQPTIDAMKQTVGSAYKSALISQQATEGVYKDFEKRLNVPPGTIVKPSDAGFKWQDAPPPVTTPTGSTATPAQALPPPPSGFGMTPQEWAVMSPQQRALFASAGVPPVPVPAQASASGGPWTTPLPR